MVQGRVPQLVCGVCVNTQIEELADGAHVSLRSRAKQLLLGGLARSAKCSWFVGGVLARRRIPLGVSLGENIISSA